MIEVYKIPIADKHTFGILIFGGIMLVITSYPNYFPRPILIMLIIFSLVGAFLCAELGIMNVIKRFKETKTG